MSKPKRVIEEGAYMAELAAKKVEKIEADLIAVGGSEGLHKLKEDIDSANDALKDSEIIKQGQEIVKQYLQCKTHVEQSHDVISELTSKIDTFTGTGLNTWKTSTLPTTNYWRSITHGNGKFVAVSALSNKAAYSVDGVTWTTASLPVEQEWTDVTFGNGIFVAVGWSNSAAYSVDGMTWKKSTMPANQFWGSITFGNGRFVAYYSISYSTITPDQCAISEDGNNWSLISLPIDVKGFSIHYGNGKFVTPGTNAIWWSDDVITWTKVSVPCSTANPPMTFGNGKFILVDNLQTLSSKDGMNWIQGGKMTERCTDVAGGNGIFIAVGSSANVSWSLDGANWSLKPMPSNKNWGAIAYGAGKFVTIVIDLMNTTNITAACQTMSSAVDTIYPVGSIMMRYDTQNPNTLSGFSHTTWSQLTSNRYIRTSTAAGSTGGSTSSEGTAITIDSMPSHTHSWSGSTSTSGSHIHSVPGKKAGVAGGRIYNSSGAQIFDPAIFIGGYDMAWGNAASDALWIGHYNRSVPNATRNDDGFYLGTETHETDANLGHTHTITGTNGSNGTGSAHSHVITPSYITLVVWRRTA